MQNEDKIRDYQDDLDADPNKQDRATIEMTDKLTDTAGIPQHELAHELKRLVIDDQGRGDEDVREQVEDLDETMGKLKSNDDSE